MALRDSLEAAPQRSLKQLIEQSKGSLEAIMPQHLRGDIERFTTMVVNAYNRNDSLRECSPMSILHAVTDAMKLGLDPVTPSLGECYLVPFSKKATFMFGYKGMCKLALQSPLVERIHADLVYEDEINQGLFSLDMARGAIRHDFSLNVDRNVDSVRFAYALADLKDARNPEIVVVTLEELLATQAKALKGKSKPKENPWFTHPKRQFRKTAARRLLNGGTVPLSTSMAASALSRDEAMESGQEPEEVFKDTDAVVVTGAEPVINEHGEIIEVVAPDGITYTSDMMSEEEWAQLTEGMK